MLSAAEKIVLVCILGVAGAVTVWLLTRSSKWDSLRNRDGRVNEKWANDIIVAVTPKSTVVDAYARQKVANLLGTNTTMTLDAADQACQSSCYWKEKKTDMGMCDCNTERNKDGHPMYGHAIRF